jgi:hypothetical protein
MSGVRKSDHPERRKLAIMRRADTESGTSHNIGGVKRRQKARPKPSLPKTPWDDDTTEHSPQKLASGSE